MNAISPITNKLSIPFFKLHGCGNDFVAIDNRDLNLTRDLMPVWAQAICQRATGIGADGLFFLAVDAERRDVDYVWDFYNADGSRAEMCGNGARCAAWIAVHLGLAGHEHVIGTDAGPVHASVVPNATRVRVQLTTPTDLRFHIPLTVENQTYDAHFINTGVPHTVLLVPRVDAIDVPNLGRIIRHHSLFAPAGTNVNWIEIQNRNQVRLRTYERGVEAETSACGTGACASVAVAHYLGLVETQVKVMTSGSEILTVSLHQNSIYLEGETALVFSGELYPSALGLKAPQHC